MPRRFLLVAFAATALGLPSFAQEPPPAKPKDAPPAAPAATAAAPDGATALDQKIMAAVKTKPEIIPNLTYLSDMIGPRLTGSAGLKKANDWTAEKMKAYGLENVHLEPYEIPVGWERGTATGRLIEPNTGQPILMASAGWAPGTKGKVEADVVIFKASKREDLAQYKGKLKNAVILRNAPAKVDPVNTPPAGPPGMNPRPMGGGGGGGPRGNFEQMQAWNQELREFLRAEGVVATFSDSGKPHGLLVTTGSWRGRERAAEQEPLPALFVAHEHYALLWRMASRPAPARTRIELEVTNKFIPGPITVNNTVGEIRGSEKPDEFVIVGAHLDSWDLAQGTTDNGTGSCVVLEVARVLAQCGVKPKRTIRFVLFTGEEQGLVGSAKYVERHKAEMDKVSMAFVHDTGTGKVIGVGLHGREVLKPIFEKELASLKEIGFKEISLRGIRGTDHQSFDNERTKVNVPGFACMQEMGEYRFTHHTQSDTLDKANEENLVQGAQVMAVTTMRVANYPTLLPRDRKPQPPRGGGN